MVVAPSYHTHKTVGRFQRHRAAIRRKRKLGRDAVQPGFGRVRRRLPGHHDFRVGEADGRDGRRGEMTAFTRNDLGHHLALCHGPVGQHGLACQIANRPDVAHRRAALIVDLDGATLHGQHQTLQPPTMRMRHAANGHQHLVGGEFAFAPRSVLHAHGVTGGVQALHLTAQ